MIQKVTQEPLTREHLLQKETLKGINKQQLKRQITIINQEQKKQDSGYQTVTAGRNPLVVSITLGKLFFKFAIGIFDEFSDWYYYFSTKGTFQLQILEDLMLYFLLIQFFIQIFAWSLIFGKLFLKQVKYKTGIDPLIDIDEQTKNETSVITWVCKTLKYTIYNTLKITYYSIISTPPAFIMMLLQETKISPFIIHGFFQYNYQVVLTEDLMENMTVQTKDKELKEKVKALKEKYRKSKGLTLDDEEFMDEDDAQKKNQNSIILKSIKLDSNMEPNLATFLFEADLEKYLRMADTIEAIFEALPLSIIQYINNELRGQSWDLISILSFGSSVLTVFIYCVSLVQFLFQDDAETLWDQWNEMEKLKKAGKYLYDLYSLPKKLTITAKQELLKLQHVSIKGLSKVKHLIIDLYKQSNESSSIISSLKHLFPKTDCQTISLRLGQCNMDFGHYQTLISNATTLKCEVFEMDLSDNHKMLQTGLDDQITLSIVKHEPITSKQKDKVMETIDLVRENEKDFQRLTFYNFKALYVNCGIRFNDLLIMFKGLAPNLFITDFELNVSNNYIFNQDLRSLDHEAISDFDVIENLNINFSDNYLEEQGIQILLELVLLNFPNLQVLKLDFSDQRRSIFVKNFQGQRGIKKTYKKGPILYYDGKTFQQDDLQVFQKYTIKKLQVPVTNQQISMIQKMLQQSNKYHSQWNEFDFSNIPEDYPLKEKLDTFNINLSNASISNYSLMQISEELIGKRLDMLKIFELDISENPLGNQGLIDLAKLGFSKMTGTTHITLSLDSLTYQFSKKVDIQGILTFSEYLPRQLQKLTISAKNNEKLADTIFANDQISFHLTEKEIKLLEEDLSVKNPIPEQIRQMCKFNQDLISLKVVSIPSSDAEVPVSFRLNQKYISNLYSKMLLKPHLFSKQISNLKQNFIQVSHIQDISKQIDQFEQGLLIGRMNDQFTPAIAFAQTDNSVSRGSALITKNEKQKYQIKCLSSASNPVSIRLQKGIKYQIFEKARIQVDRSYSSIYIDIQAIGQNDYLTESDKEFHPEIQSWSFISKKNKTMAQIQEEEEIDSDRTMNDDDMMMIPQSVSQQQIQLPSQQIQLSVQNQWTTGKQFYTFDVDPKKQSENDEGLISNNKIADYGLEDEQPQPKQGLQNSKKLQKNKIKIAQLNKFQGGTEKEPQLVNLSVFDKQQIKFGADENISNFPLKTVESQVQIERIHLIIGRERLGEKQIWYVKLDDDYHNDLTKVSETFLNLKTFDQQENSENFEIYDNMQFNVGFTVMELGLLGSNSTEYLDKERHRQLEPKQSVSSHVINLKILDK